jgi:hypothetical protein
MNLKLLEEIMDDIALSSKGMGHDIQNLEQVELNETDCVGFLVNRDWQKEFCRALIDMGFDSYGMCDNGDWGFENDVFIMRPYYWGDSEYISELPNFEHKRTGFKLAWYKYPLRSSYMNKDVSKEQLFWMLNDCKERLTEKDKKRLIE